MGWIILTAFCIVVAIVGVGYAIYSNATWEARVAAWERGGKYGSSPTNFSLAGWAVVGVVAVVWLAFTGFAMFHTVGQREVAIVYSFSGTITGKKDPGLVTTMPWEHIKKENVGIKHDEWDFSIENSSSAVSKDQQRIGALLSVNYQIDSANVVDLYKRVGPSWKTIIIDARVPQVFKEVTATYATQDITANREQLRLDTKGRLTRELAPYDIDVVDVFIKNLGFSQSYTEAVDAKQRQVQDALRAEAKVRQVRAEADQTVAAAEGEAKANIARARGDAASNKLRQRSLTPALIQWEAIQKLNPNVALIFCPPASVCIPNAGVVPTPNK